MSRCFPYPPPGYVENGIRDEALIESIKIQKKVKKERKKDKKEKKEKKREKKERNKGRSSGEIESKKHGYKKRRKNESNLEDQKGGEKIRENEAESLENSTITEEHGQAVGPQNSSDRTLNSNKRQKLSLPPDSGHNHGSVIRIRLPCQRHKDPEVLPSKEEPCSTSGRIDDALVQRMHGNAPRPNREPEELPCSTASTSHPELTFKLSEEKPCSSSFASESLLSHNAEASMPSNLCSSRARKLALKFKSLVEDWVAPAVQTEQTSFDEDWLFQKQNLKSGVKGNNTIGNFGPSQINSPTWPHACYMPEADIYALPFTIPY